MHSSSKLTCSASTSAADRGNVISSSGRRGPRPLGGTYRTTRFMTGTASRPERPATGALHHTQAAALTQPPSCGNSGAPAPGRPAAAAGLEKYTSSGWGEAPLALKAGVPVKVVSERLGHESPAFTLK